MRYLQPTTFSQLYKIVFALLICLPMTATAQSVQFTQNTADQSLRGNLQVDPSTMAMSFGLNLGGYGGRGVSLPLTLSYSSKAWQVEYLTTYQGQIQTFTHSRANYGKYSVAGWNASTDIPFIESPNQRFDGSGNSVGSDYPDTPYFIHRILAHLPDGSTHELRKNDTPVALANPPALSGIYYAVDGSRLRYDADLAVLTLPDGSRYFLNASGGVQYIDRQGNKLTYNSTSKQWTDTLGRNFGLPSLNNTAATPPAYPLEYEIPGIGTSKLVYKFHWRNLRDNTTGQTMLTNPNNPADPNPWNPGTGTNPLKYKGDRTCMPNNTALSPSLFTSSDPDRICGNIGTYFNPIVLYQIELPNQKKYTFTYNVYGEIDKIQLPTGGYERYEYALIPGVDPELTGSYAQSNRGVTKQWVSVKGDGTDEYVRNYSATQTGTYVTTATAPDNTRAERTIYFGGNAGYGFDDPRNARANDERVYDANNVMLRRTLTEWETSGAQAGGWAGAKRNPRPKRQVEILLDTGGNALAKATEMDYDIDQNVMATRLYDYTSISQATAQTGAITTIANGALLKTQEATFLVNDTSLAAATRTAYWNRNLVGLPTSSRLKNSGGTIVAQGEIKYDETAYPLLTYATVNSWVDPATTVRGNATTSRSWLNTNNSWLETHAQYDQCGNVRSSWDANGNQSQVVYMDSFSNSTNYNSYAYPTQTTSPNSVLISSTKYDYQTGKAIEATDPNNVKTQMEYNDLLLRPTKTIQGIVGSTGTSQSVIQYDDTNRTITTIADQNTYQESNSGTGIKSLIKFDGLGRGVRSAAFEGSTWSITDAEFDNMGRVKRTTNPFRDANVTVATPANAEWTTTTYDALSRASKVTSPDTAFVESRYYGNIVTVIDQAKKVRRSVTDGLGRLFRVDEPNRDFTAAELAQNPLNPDLLLGASTAPVQATSYAYDTLDNLTTVTQGVQTRSFVYDSLKRLTSATNPESGAMNYVYDSNGNLKQKSDALGRILYYNYDALNRNNETFSNNAQTPYVLRVYDTATNGKGRLGYNMTNSWYPGGSGQYLDHTAIDSYDALGRPLVQRQHYRINNDTAWSAAYQTSQTYDLAGNLKSKTYPSGRVANYNYNTAGQMTTFTGNLGDGTTRNYTTGMTYTPAGQLTQENFGVNVSANVPNGIWHNTHYNNRLQMTDTRIGTGINDGQGQEWTWNRGAIRMFYAAGNNGNITRMDHYVPTNEAASTYAMSLDYYGYDHLNRITGIWENKQTDTMSETTTNLTQQYTYDRYGNRLVNNAVSTFPVQNSPYTVNTANNRLQSSGSCMTFDAVGNLTNDCGRTRVYDGNNKMISAYDAGVATSYRYNADGQRVIKTVGTVSTWNIYGMGGELIAEYPANGATNMPQMEYGYRNGQMLVEGGCDVVRWLVADHLGTPRMSVDITGTLTNMKRHDYLPFGEEIGAGVGIRTAAQGYAADCIRQKFTSYERDVETGLDYAQARYMSSIQGRFTGVDPLMASASTLAPQTWNRYSYAGNNPLINVDPTGEAYKDLSKEQLRVFQSYVDKQNEGRETALSAEAVYNGLNESQQTTFESVTHALENTMLTDKNGKPITDKDGKSLSVLSQVTGVNQISGEIVGEKEGRKQFRLLVDLKEGAVDKLRSSKSFYGGSTGHVYKNGIVTDANDFRGDFGVPSPQISYLPDNKTADIDIDYESKRSKAHYEPPNSDVRSGNHLEKHNKQFGKENPLRNIPQTPKK